MFITQGLEKKFVPKFLNHCTLYCHQIFIITDEKKIGKSFFLLELFIHGHRVHIQTCPPNLFDWLDFREPKKMN